MRFFYLILLLVLFSCSKEDDLQTDTILECLGEAEIPIFPRTCDNFLSNDLFCDISDVGEFQLEESSKEFMRYACSEIGDKLKFQNENNEELEFEIVRKQYQSVMVGFSTSNICQSDSSKVEGICVSIELITLKLVSLNPELELTIEIKNFPEINDDVFEGVGDFLQINRSIGGNSFITELFAVISQRSLSFEQSPSQENIESIEILNETFTDVISRDINNFTGDPFKYYYSKSDGLIGFQDSDGVLWKRE